MTENIQALEMWMIAGPAILRAVLNLTTASKQPMIERNHTNILNNTLVFKLNMSKKYEL